MSTDGPVPGGTPGDAPPGGTPGDAPPGGTPGDAPPGSTTPGGTIPGDLDHRVRAWIADDPSAADRGELQDLLGAAAREDAAGQAAAAGLADRFAGRLQFGTAGLRGAMGAGPNRMNRAVVRAATAGLARWLREHRPDAAGAGVVLGWDARHRSAEFAADGGGRADRRGRPRASAAGPEPHAAARVRDPAPVRRGRRDDHRQPQPPCRQRLQALPGRRRADRAAGRRRDRGRHPWPGRTVADPAGAAGQPAGHPARGRDRRGLPGHDPGRLPGRRLRGPAPACAWCTRPCTGSRAR